MTTLRKVQRYGWHPSLPDPRDQMMAVEPADLQNLPPKIDLVDGNMPPVWDQGDIGSCTAHGTLAAVEYERKKDKAAAGDFMPSRLFQYYNSRLLEGTAGQDSGATVRDAVKATAVYGVLKETELPYDVHKFTQRPTTQMYTDAKKCLVQRYQRVPQSLVYLKAALRKGYVVVFGFSVYESFESEPVAKTGVVPMPDVSREAMVGGHCVAAVGYDDATRLFKVRNSWGVGWGDKGYCYMPYAMLTDKSLSDDYWSIDLLSS